MQVCRRKSKALQGLPFLATSISSSVQRDVSTGSVEAERETKTLSREKTRTHYHGTNYASHSQEIYLHFGWLRSLGKALLSEGSSQSPLNQVRDTEGTTMISGEKTVQNYSAYKTVINCLSRKICK